MTSQDQRLRELARALLVIEQRVLADVVKLVLNHGHHNTRVAPTVSEAATAVRFWRVKAFVAGLIALSAVIGLLLAAFTLAVIIAVLLLIVVVVALAVAIVRTTVGRLNGNGSGAPHFRYVEATNTPRASRGQLSELL